MTQQDLGANQFTLSDGITTISYLLVKPGPVKPGVDLGPELTYNGPLGNHTFHKDQIQTQTSPIGTLVTVILEFNAGAGQTNLTLILPHFRLTHGETQPFDAVAILTKSTGNLVRDGAQTSYEVLTLQGKAQLAFLPL